MITNKRIFQTAAALTLALSLFAAGCSNGKNGDSAGPEPSESPSAAAETSSEPSPSSASEGESSAAPSAEAEQLEGASPSPTAPEASAAPSAETKPAEEAAVKPTAKPTSKPTVKPTAKPTAKPVQPTAKPTAKPAEKPATAKPSVKPTEQPTAELEETVSVTAIMDKILTDVEMPRLISVTGEQVKDSYYFNPDEQISEGVYNQAMMNTKATEVVVVKLKSEEHFDAVEEGLTKRAEDIIETFSTYLQDQHEDAKNYQIVRHGKYVMLSISHDQQAVKAAFDSFFK